MVFHTKSFTWWLLTLLLRRILLFIQISALTGWMVLELRVVSKYFFSGSSNTITSGFERSFFGAIRWVNKHFNTQLIWSKIFPNTFFSCITSSASFASLKEKVRKICGCSFLSLYKSQSVFTHYKSNWMYILPSESHLVDCSDNLPNKHLVHLHSSQEGDSLEFVE